MHWIRCTGSICPRYRGKRSWEWFLLIALSLITAIIPINLLTKERRAILLRKAEVGKEAASRDEKSYNLKRWQRTLEEETTGRWTVFIKSVKPWIAGKDEEVGFYLTQYLSGHWYFQSYLHRIGRATSPNCLYSPSVIYDEEHTFFTCEKWPQRRSVVTELGLTAPSSIFGTMIHEEDTWNTICITICRRHPAVEEGGWYGPSGKTLDWSRCEFFVIWRLVSLK